MHIIKKYFTLLSCKPLVYSAFIFANFIDENVVSTLFETGFSSSSAKFCMGVKSESSEISARTLDWKKHGQQVYLSSEKNVKIKLKAVFLFPILFLLPLFFMFLRR